MTMEPKQATYPIFEANQVLTNTHLNDVFNYLDEGERLTRANLIGIGIVCGLDIQFDPAKNQIHLSKGCGVTSQGYLIVEQEEDLILGAYRVYRLPDDVAYPTFKDNAATLWELVPAVTPNSNALPLTNAFLLDKAVVLFVELDREGLRNCSPDNCDDKGSQVTVTIRKLLIQTADLTNIIATSQGLDAGITESDLVDALNERLGLQDIRMPRYDVPNTPLVSTNDVLFGFLLPFREWKLVDTLDTALRAAYSAFQPILKDVYKDLPDPIKKFKATFGFLDTAPVVIAQALPLQHYYDLFDDLIKAYDEFRWAGAELLCACCPPQELFPRHLMLGMPLDPTADHYRQPFLASSATEGTNGCDARSDEVRLLFQRLVEMIAQFTDQPPPPKTAGDNTQNGMRITPSKLGDARLSDKAIPYYYRQDGAPALNTLWNAEKTRRGRANQNLGYRSDEYIPAAPSWVKDALRYDLEPNNFLRIEGHLGQDYLKVLQALETLKLRYRLPIEVIALRTGVFDEKLDMIPAADDCRFQDLDTLYATLKDDLNSFLSQETAYLYKLPRQIDSPVKTPVKPLHSLVVLRSPDTMVLPNTFGRLFEDRLLASQAVSAVDPFNIAVLNLAPLTELDKAIADVIASMADMSKRLTVDLAQFDYNGFQNSFINLVAHATIAKPLIEKQGADAKDQGLAWEELYDRMDEIIGQSRPDAFKALIEEYKRRLMDAKRRQYLEHFLQQHPGIQHKAGVPLGGSFIIVYHETSIPIEALNGAVLEKAVSALAKGVVIADFFLPYVCCSDCAPIQFVLPKQTPAFTLRIGCADDKSNEADVTLTPAAGIPPYEVSVDRGDYQPLTGAIRLGAGPHKLTIRDADENESVTQDILISEPLKVSDPIYECSEDGKTYKAQLTITGGTLPYSANGVEFQGDKYSTDPIAGGKSVDIQVTDKFGCAANTRVQHDCCDLPCKGEAVRCGYLFWLPESTKERPLTDYQASIKSFSIAGKDGSQVVIGGLNISAKPDDLNNQFAQTAQDWLDGINKAITNNLNDGDWFSLSYRPGDNNHLQTLFIEHYACGDFAAFTIEVDVRYAIGDFVENRTVTYDATGTKMHLGMGDLQSDIAIPPYDCETANKCDPIPVWTQKCGDAGVGLKIEAKTSQNNATLTAFPAGDVKISEYLWQVDDAIPSLSTGNPATIEFSTLAPLAKRVRLTAFTDNQCSATIEDVFALKSQPTFSMQTGCANDKQQAEVILTPVTGSAPFEASIDGAAYQPLAGPLLLNARPKEYVITIRDANGIESVQQVVTIAEQLQIHAQKYTCSGDNKTYTAELLITGGTAPYKVNGVAIPGDKDVRFVTDPIADGKAVDIQVTDAHNCPATTSVQHDCCNLPCSGEAIQCGYLFWLPEPRKEHPLTNYAGRVRQFTIAGTDGAPIQIGGLDIGGVDIAAHQVALNGNFTQTVQGWLDGINKAIVDQAKADNWFSLSYRPSDANGPQTLVIEHFNCDKFADFTIALEITYGYGEFIETRTVVYTLNGTQMHLQAGNQKSDILIPPFGCKTANKCDAKPDWRPKCDGTDAVLKMDGKMEQNVAILNGSAGGNDQPAQYMWEVEDASPSVLLGQNVKTQIAILTPLIKRVRLTAFTQKGCVVTLDGTITVKG